MDLQLLLGFNLAIIISVLAYALSALSLYGAVASSLLGFIVFGLGGLDWAILLLAFFITSSALSKVAKRRKEKLEEKFSKGSRRDAAQVLANGGVAGVFVLLHAFFPGSSWPWIGFAASLAAANADTWATELGVLSPALPRSITTGKPVERGVSGAVSVTGVLAAAVGALLIGLLAALFFPGFAVIPLSGGANDFPSGTTTLAYTLLFGLAGLAGSLVDSLLGGTVQAIYTCPACRKITERHPFHSCGTPTTLLRGLPWLNNDWVNFACTLSSAIIALGAYFLFIL